MKTLRCSDMGMKCSFIATGKDNKETKARLMEHVSKIHKDMLKKTTAEEKKAMDKKMDKLLK